MPDIPILAEGHGWLVVAKPPGFWVHRQARSDPEEFLLLQRVRDQVGQYLYPVHRLDRPASGCVVFATTPERATQLQAALLKDSAHKQYIGIARGQLLQEGEITVERPMKDDNGLVKDAHSTLRVLATCPEPRCSFMLLTPHTGRYHQLRRHARDLNHPLWGDMQHGDRRLNRSLVEQGIIRLQLHAMQLKLELDDGWVEAQCPLFSDMQAVLKGLPFWENIATQLPELRLPAFESDLRAIAAGP